MAKPFGRARCRRGRNLQHGTTGRPCGQDSIALCRFDHRIGHHFQQRPEDGGPGKPVSEGGLGYSCIAEIRMIEKIATGEFKTPFMKAGDTVAIDMHDADGHSIFGRIEQVVEAV